MKILILLCLLACSLAEVEIPYKGMIMAATKQHLARDILYIVRQVVGNVKSGPFPDILDTKSNGIYKEEMHIKNIEVVGVEYYPQDAEKSAEYSHEERKFFVTSKNQVIKYLIKFSWRVAAMNIDIAFGDGFATAFSTSLKATVVLPSKEMSATLSASFDVNFANVTGRSVSDEIKTWLKKKLISNTTNIMGNIISRGASLITEYIFKPYLYAKRLINDGPHFIGYHNIPAETTEHEGNIWVSFNTELKLNDVNPWTLQKEYPMPSSKGLVDVGFFMAPGFVSAAADIHRFLGVFDKEYDLTQFGYTGKIKEFFQSMPELAGRYPSSEKVKLTCKVSGVNEEKDSIEIHFEQDCFFRAESSNEPFLTAQLCHQMVFTPYKTADEQKLFIARLQKSKLHELSTVPNSHDIEFFFSKLFTKMGQAFFDQQIVHLPRLRFEPLRKYAKMDVQTTNDYYVAFYEVRDQLRFTTLL